MKIRHLLFSIIFIFCSQTLLGLQILIPMNLTQKDHLKSYGIAYWILNKGGEVDWLLNYEGGSFLFNFDV